MSAPTTTIEDLRSAKLFECEDAQAFLILEVVGSAETRRYFIRKHDLSRISELFDHDALFPCDAAEVH